MTDTTDISTTFENSSGIQESSTFIHGVREYTEQFIGRGPTVPTPKTDDDYPAAAQETQRLLQSGNDIIFGAVAYDPERATYVRASALVKNANGAFDVIKVTSSTKVKPDHVWDVSEAWHGFSHAGIPVGEAFVMHVNNKYEKAGDIDPHAFLKSVNVTAKLKAPENFSKRPVSGSGSYQPPVGEESHEPGQIQEFLGRLEYPLYFLDYETISSTVPVFDGTRPYQQIPFQFSLHVQASPDAPLEHHEFLHKDQTDPRRPLTEKLVELCGESGTVLVYFEGFEKARNIELAQAFPEYAPALHGINERIVDLYEPFKNRWLYHPAQQGSASIKFVLPAFTDLGYGDLNIQKGDKAAEEYLAFMNGQKNPAEQEQLWSDLLAYCKLDTYAMVSLLEVLRYYSVPREQVIANTPAEPAL